MKVLRRRHRKNHPQHPQQLDFVIDDPENPFRLSASPQRGIAKSLYVEIKVLCNAFTMRFLQSIVGPLGTVVVEPADRFSEWAAIRLWLRRKEWINLGTIGIVSVGSIVFPPVSIPLMIGTGRRRVMVTGHNFSGNNNRPYQENGRDYDGETWIYINGVSVTRELQKMNGLQLSDLFQREILCFHNPTQGMLWDLVECMVGRTLNKIGKVARKEADFLRFVFAEHPNNKVILIAHSQGTIVTSNAIEFIIKEDGGAGLDRLEVYTFGCAATEFFKVRDKRTGRLVPFYEHYANQSDYVAKIGALRDRGKYPFPFPGNIFTCEKEGHLLGEHYLPSVRRREYQCLQDGTTIASRLYTYIDANGPSLFPSS
ncbi:(4-O-methyl)-D-glucuronate--lignin esterase [Balamuthia mandrillaris]